MNKILIGIIGLGLMVTSYCDFSGARGYATKTMSVGKSTYSGTNTLQVSGNVGITGTVSASALQVNGGIGAFQGNNNETDSLVLRKSVVSAVVGKENVISLYHDQTNGQYIRTAKIAAESRTSWGGALVFSVKPANGINTTTAVVEAMRIDSSGNVGIGTTTPSTKLEVAGTVSANNLNLTSLTAANNTALYVDAAGVVTKATSSRRYKTNIGDLDIDSSKVYQVSPKSWNYKNYDVSGNMTVGQRNIGAIAEDVNEVLPELVNYDGEGQPDSIKESQFIWLLLEEVKKLKSRIEVLETK